MCVSVGICESWGLFGDTVTRVSDLASLGHARLFLSVEGTLGSRVEQVTATSPCSLFWTQITLRLAETAHR